MYFNAPHTGVMGGGDWLAEFVSREEVVAYHLMAKEGDHVDGGDQVGNPTKKGALVGMVNRAPGPALGSWEDRPPAAYKVFLG